MLLEEVLRLASADDQAVFFREMSSHPLAPGSKLALPEVGIQLAKGPDVIRTRNQDGAPSPSILGHTKALELADLLPGEPFCWQPTPPQN